MSTATLAHAPALTDDQIDRILDATADSFVRQLRSPILHAPSEQNLVYEEVTFPALDGVPLEGWFIPADGSEKLIIANHPMGFSRSGIPAHLEPWRSIWSSSGNAFEVNFIPDYKRPAIMWADAFVPGPVMIRGMTEASATRKPVRPCTRSWGSTTASLSTPILQVPTACPKLAEPSLASSWISSALALGPGMSSLSRKLSKACWLPSSRAASIARTMAAKSRSVPR